MLKNVTIMISRKSEATNNNQLISSNLKAIGTFQRCTLSEAYRFAVEQSIGPFDLNSTFSFKRMFNGKDILHCLNYKAVTRRNSYTVSYIHGGIICFGHIMFFLKVNPLCNNSVACNEFCRCTIPSFLALFKALHVDENVILSEDTYSNTTLAHLFPVQKDSQEPTVIAKNVEAIQHLCLFIDCQNSNYNFVSIFPNRYEKD